MTFHFEMRMKPQSVRTVMLANGPYSKASLRAMGPLDDSWRPSPPGVIPRSEPSHFSTEPQDQRDLSRQETERPPGRGSPWIRPPGTEGPPDDSGPAFMRSDLPGVPYIAFSDPIIESFFPKYAWSCSFGCRHSRDSNDSMVSEPQRGLSCFLSPRGSSLLRHKCFNNQGSRLPIHPSNCQSSRG